MFDAISGLPGLRKAFGRIRFGDERAQQSVFECVFHARGGTPAQIVGHLGARVTTGRFVISRGADGDRGGVECDEIENGRNKTRLTVSETLG